MGSSGHLSHLVEDWELTFADLKDVVSAAADARLESVTEKTDGTELVFTWDEAAGRIGAARNGSDIKGGGMTAAALSKRFAGRGGLEVALTSAFDALTRAVSALPIDARTALFGPSGERWYSIEIMHSAWPRTIHYAGDNIVFHERPVFTVDKATGRVEKDNGTAGRALSKWIDALRTGVSGTSWTLHPRAAVELERLTDGTVMAQALSRLGAAQAETRTSDGDTIATYVRRRLDSLVDEDTGLTLPDDVHAGLVSRLMHDQGAPTVTALARMAPELSSHVRAVVAREKELIDSAIEPLEVAIREFANGVLRGVRSLFIDNHEGEADRLRAAVNAALAALQHASGPKARAAIAAQASKIGRLDDISPIEGIVFMYKGRPYKFTGSFAPVNRVLSFIAFGNLAEGRSTPRALVLVGGGAFDDVAPVSLATLRDTWPRIEAVLRAAGASRIEPIGTTWKKDPMGDVDVAVTHEGGREELYSALAAELGAQSLRRVGSNIVSIAFPATSGERVQVDAMVGDVDYLAWSRYGPSPTKDHSEHSSVKGVVRNMLLNVIAAHASGRTFPGRQTDLDRERYVVDFDRGLYRVVQTRRPTGKRTAPLSDWKTLERELVASTPDDVVSTLLGPGHRAHALRRFEDVVAALRRSPDFRRELGSILDGLTAKLREHVEEGRSLGAPLDDVLASVKQAFGRDP